jgi:mannose-6-phosphate isomerase
MKLMQKMEPYHVLRQPILLEPEYRDYVWGGNRLKPPESPIAEMWAIYENDRIAGGPLAGRKLGEVAAEHEEALLGSKPAKLTGKRFPLLIKLLDCARWLSVQVHPNNEQAFRLEGPDQFGKTEAWYIIEADSGAELLAGLKPGLDQQKLKEVMRGGDKIMDWLKHYQVQAGDSILIPPGTVHALGPGLLVYEVQQTSDITYRAFDWNRPASEGRKLHIEQSLAVIDVRARSEPQHLPEPPHPRDPMVSTQYFQLEHLQVDYKPLDLDTKGESFHALTAIAGAAILEGENWVQPLNRFQSVAVPAAVGRYCLHANEKCQVLKSSV